MHIAGEEAEVDWYEAYVDFPLGRQKVYIFQMRACYSGNEFHMAFERQNQQSCIEAHVAAFHYFEGAFKTIRYDNLTSAVKKVVSKIRTSLDVSLAFLTKYNLLDKDRLPAPLEANVGLKKGKR